MKAYANGLISRQYFFDKTYFHLLLGLKVAYFDFFVKKIEIFFFSKLILKYYDS